MFEKEAEEYAEKVYGSSTEIDHYGIADAFKDGVEFGYNKANEWHYVKDGDFPKDKTEKEYLVALKSEYIDFFYETDIWCESLHCFASNNPKKVYAWKEIVPPELPKESEFKSDILPEITLPKGSAEFIDKAITDAEKRLKESE